MRKLPDLTDRRFGMLLVLSRAPSQSDGKRRWLCRCDCGRETIVTTANLTSGHTTSCGCKKQNDLTGQKIGKLTVLERSDKFASRGARQVRLWKCRCDCGAITYKATDTLTNKEKNMCKECAGRYGASKARENAGFVEGTQLAKIKVDSQKSDNTTGVRGVYLESKTGRYRARITFQGKRHNLGTFASLQEAVDARRRAEEELFDTFLSNVGQV